MSGAKFSMYELLGYLMPGTVLVLPLYYWASSKYPSFAAQAEDGVMTATVFLVLCFLVGHFIQAISSGVLERFYLWITGGHPNIVIKSKGIRNMKPEHWVTAKQNILLNTKRCTDENEVSKYDDEETIRIAIGLSRGKGKVDIFNALYAFNRGLTTAILALLVLLVLLSIYAEPANLLVNVTIVLICLVLLIIQLFRLRTRSEYFLEETIRQAEASFMGN